MPIQSFQPTAFATLLVAVAIMTMASLGAWQLQRAETKRALQAEFEAQRNAPPRSLTGRPMRGPELRYTHVRLLGDYLPQYEILLNNQIHNGISGYHVLTPLRIVGSAMHVLVNRGWVASDPGSTSAPAGVQTLTGVVVVPEANVFSPALPAQRGWPRVWYTLDLEDYARRVPFALQPFVVRLDEGVGGGFLRRWRPVDLRPQRHTAYAFQWFAMTLAGVLLYVIHGVRRARLLRESAR